MKCIFEGFGESRLCYNGTTLYRRKYMSIFQIYGVYTHGIRRHFRNAWNIIDVIVFVMSCVAVGLLVTRAFITDRLLASFRLDTTAFVNFQQVAMWDEYLSCALGLLVFFFTVDLMRILQFNKQVSDDGLTSVILIQRWQSRSNILLDHRFVLNQVNHNTI